MKKEDFIKKIKEYAKEFLIELTEEQIEKFYTYMELLLEWNKKINLTAITEPNEIILKHFIDSLTINKYIKSSEKIVDVGTGAGFPGIPIAIIRNDVNIVLVDSLNKRINFLSEVINKLELKNIIAIHSRAEDFGRMKEYRENFDKATSRAVANLATLSEYLMPLIKIKGECICMKGAEIESELKESKKAVEILGGKVKDIDSFNLPNSDFSRNIIIIEKTNKTDKKYPRKPGTPSKEPIK